VIDKPLGEIAEADIRGLIGGPELRTLDFKEWLPGEIKPGGRPPKTPGADFAGDVAALANTEGGDLVFGVSERETDDGPRLGRAARVVGLGVAESDHDRLESTLDQWLGQELDPRFRGVAYHWVPLADGRWALVARVARSFNAPHMVRGTSKFMYRTNRTNEPMNADQVRSAFLAADALPEKMERFRDGRLARIAINDRLPVGLSPGGRVVLHVVPVASLERGARIDLTGVKASAASDPLMLPPSPQPGREPRHNFEGFAVASRRLWQGGHESYLQIFRNGSIEAVTAGGMGKHPEYGPLLNPRMVEQHLIDRLSRYLALILQLGSSSPAFVLVSLVRAAAHRFAIGDPAMGLGQELAHDPMPLPECYWEGGDDEPDTTLAATLLRPAFDALWQAGGFERSKSYLESGSWSYDGNVPFDFAKWNGG